MKIPPRPNFKSESEEYFLHAYARLTQYQTHEVSMFNWRLDHVQNDLFEIMADWEHKGWGRVVRSRSSLGYESTTFVFSDAGVTAGKRLTNRTVRGRRIRALGTNLSVRLNLISTWIAALAAVAAAWFSYLGLQKS